MIKALRNLSFALIAVIFFVVPISGCNLGGDKGTLLPVSSAQADRSAVISSPDIVSSSTVSYGTAWKNITGKVRLAKAADDWKLIETEPLDENSQYLTYSIGVQATVLLCAALRGDGYRAHPAVGGHAHAGWTVLCGVYSGFVYRACPWAVAAGGEEL